MFDPLAARKGTRQELRSLAIFLLFLAACFALFVYPYMDDFDVSESECREINAYWVKQAADDFSFTDEWEQGPFECPSPESGIARSLMFIETLQAPLERTGTKVSFYAWATSLKPVFSKRILFGLSGRTSFEDRIISFSPLVLEENNWVKIAGVLIHELRHLEEGLNTHVPCARNSGKSCDLRLMENPAEGGAYNYNVLFFHLIAQSEETSRYEKRLARRELKRILEDHFNFTPANALELYGF